MLKKSCAKCAHFEHRTHFCRLAPPQPVVFIGEDNDGNGGIRQSVSSKFPVVVHPDLDYCSHYSGSSEGMLINEG